MMIRYMIIETYLLVRLVMAAAQQLVVQVLLEILRHLLRNVLGVEVCGLDQLFLWPSCFHNGNRILIMYYILVYILEQFEFKLLRLKLN